MVMTKTGHTHMHTSVHTLKLLPRKLLFIYLYIYFHIKINFEGSNDNHFPHNFYQFITHLQDYNNFRTHWIFMKDKRNGEKE